MSVMSSQIIGVSIVCSTVCAGAVKKNIKAQRHRSFEGNPSVTGGFPLQRASNAKKFLFDYVIMVESVLISEHDILRFREYSNNILF